MTSQPRTLAETKQALWLNTSEANRLFVKKITRSKSLAHTVIRQMVLANSLAAQGKVYAIMMLHDWMSLMHANDEILQAELIELNQALRLYTPQSDIQPPKGHRQMIAVNYPTIVRLLSLIKHYDQVIWLLKCAKNAGVFEKLSYYFRAKMKITARVNHFLGKMAYQSIKSLPSLNIADYINRPTDYPDINPAKLILAIQMIVRLNKTDGEVRSIIRQLRELKN